MIAILGAGSLGRLWAATLPTGQVAFVPRPEQPGGQLAYRFRPFDGPEYQVRIPWLTATHRPTLLVVTTKAGDTLSALANTLPTLPENTPAVLLQNGLVSQQRVMEQWPDHPLFAASTTEGANRPEFNLAIHAGLGETWVGALNESGDAHLTKVVHLLAQSSLTVHAELDILNRLWQKLVINAGINAFTALLNCPNGAILDQAFYQQWIDPLCREVSRLMIAAGQPEQSPEGLRKKIETVARKTAANTSSMRADVLAGRSTEIDFINGYLVRLGKAHGIATPVNQMLTERVKQLN